MKNDIQALFGIPVIESPLLANGTAYLVVQEKGVVKQIQQVYPTPLNQYSTPDLIAELEKRRPKCEDCIQNYKYLNERHRCDLCMWREERLRVDNFKEAK